jgi:hypothetical protein
VCVLVFSAFRVPYCCLHLLLAVVESVVTRSLVLRCWYVSVGALVLPLQERERESAPAYGVLAVVPSLLSIQ